MLLYMQKREIPSTEYTKLYHFQIYPLRVITLPHFKQCTQCTHH